MLNYLILHWIINQVPIDTVYIVILQHGISTFSDTVHAGTGSGVLRWINAIAWHNFYLVLSFTKRSHLCFRLGSVAKELPARALAQFAQRVDQTIVT